MLDIKFVRENPNLIKEAAKNKNREVDVDKILKLDLQRRDLIQSVQKLREERNEISSVKPPSKDQIEKGKKIKVELKKIEDQLKPVDAELNNLMLYLVNVPLDEVPVGKDETGNKELKKWGTPRKFDFEPKDHIELGKELDIMDLERGSKVSGFRGYFLKNEGAILHMALLFYVFQKLTKKGYNPFIAPSIVREFTLFGSGHFPWGSEQDVYKLNADDSYLSGTAEIPITAYYSGEILNEKDLPKRFVGFSPCFRKEAGAYGKDTRGLYRLHEFWKIEQVILGLNNIDEAKKIHEELENNSEEILKDLNLPYRQLLMCTGDMGEPQLKKYDIETWMPSRKAYGETMSNSIMGDFQSRRLDIRYKTKDPQSMFEKLWNSHVVYQKNKNYPAIFYIDAHLIHEVTSPQAFQGLRQRGLPVYRKERTWGTADHNVPTKNQHLPIKELLSRKQVEMLIQNTKDFDVRLYGLGHPFQGIVHVIGPELGISQPGKSMVCGDSHTSTHGALGAYAFGVGTSEVEQVLATQCILQNKPKSMRIKIDGVLAKGVTAKDVVLYIISKLSASGGTGYFVEYAGEVFENMSMEERMTVCNMSIEMGARGGMIAPDEKTFEYLKDREFSPKGADWEKMVEYWRSLASDENAVFDREEIFNAAYIEPMITYGTNPGMGIKITQSIPQETDFKTTSDKNQLKKSLSYMGLKEGQKIIGQHIDYVFFGSCTNSRIEDFREAAKILKGRKKAKHVEAILVPGSTQVLNQAREEGLDKIFSDAGFELRSAGCSACLGMNEDKIPAGKYCVSTSNRNFEGRQGPGARTLLASPLTAAASAIKGVVSDPREFID